VDDACGNTAVFTLLLSARTSFELVLLSEQAVIKTSMEADRDNTILFIFIFYLGGLQISQLF
jgi:hypothetical protein